MKSRLDRNLEEKTRKKFFWSLFGTVVILFLVFKYGIPLLANVSLFLGSSKETTTNEKSKKQQFISVPILDNIISATNSATISVSGNADQKEKVRLFVNDAYADVVDTNDNGNFVFKDVTLEKGENTIKVKAKKNDNESDFSEEVKVIYKNAAPSLTLDTPQDGQSFTKDQSSVDIKGKTDPDVKVTINDFWAIVDSEGKYSYNLHLQNGDNQIKVVATDAAGNKTEKTIKITYAQ